MALKFRLKGLAETFIDFLNCPCCGYSSDIEDDFATDLTKITPEGIIVVAECRFCGEIFVPEAQQLGVLNPRLLSIAIENEKKINNSNILDGFKAVQFNAEQLNAVKKDLLH